MPRGVENLQRKACIIQPIALVIILGVDQWAVGKAFRQRKLSAVDIDGATHPLCQKSHTAHMVKMAVGQQDCINGLA